MGAGVKTFLKIAASVFALLAAVAAYGVYELWPEPYKPTYTVDLPMLNGVPGVVLAVEDPKSELAIEIFGGVLEAKFRGEPIEGFWQPSEQQLVGFEQKLRKHVLGNPPSEADGAQLICQFNEADLMQDLLANSFRQYVGVIAGGEKYLHVAGVGRWLFEFDPSQSKFEDLAHSYQMTADGGPTSFVANYDIEKDEFVSFYYDQFYAGAC